MRLESFGPKGLRVALPLVSFPAIYFLPSWFRGLSTVRSRLAWEGLGTERAILARGGFSKCCSKKCVCGGGEFKKKKSL